MFRTLKNQLGLAADEFILSAIMLSSVSAFIVVNIPWNSLTASPEKLVESLQNIEQANSEFYRLHRVWPHETTNGDWKSNINALISPRAMRYPYNNLSQFKNHISELSMSYNENGVRHEFGLGGYVLQRPITKAGDTYLEVILEDVPVAEATQLDRKLDGEFDPSKGRVTMDKSTNNDGLTTVYYKANIL
jgi:hypothetical protein